jgi:hypothetical protein
VTGDRNPRKLLLLVAGFVLWSSAFVVLYGIQALGCHLGWDDISLGPVTLNRTALLAVWVVHLCLIGLLAAALARRRASAGDLPFIERAGLALTFCALAATIWIGFPVLAAGSTCT